MDSLAMRFRTPLIRYFVRRGAEHGAAEDLAQEVFLRFTRKGLADVENPEAYLFTTAASVMVDAARRARTRCERAHVCIDEVELVSGAPSPERVFEGRQALVRLAELLDELPEKTREIFLLSRLDRLTNTQLAARYGISVSSIEKHMTKALAHIRTRFKADD